MEIKKKQLTKADGRYMLLYHFPATATAEQAEAFRFAEKHLAETESAIPADSAPEAPSDVKFQKEIG